MMQVLVEYKPMYYPWAGNAHGMDQVLLQAL